MLDRGLINCICIYVYLFKNINVVDFKKIYYSYIILIIN